MPESRAIIFISGLNLRPIYAEKFAYYERIEMAGKFLPNPYHPPQHSVRVMTQYGWHTCRVRNLPVPPEVAHLPQYKSGWWSFVDGYRPKLGRNHHDIL